MAAFGSVGVEAGPLRTLPPISEVLPLEDTASGVKSVSPFLLNLQTIVPAQSILRVCYVRPQSNDPIVNEIRNEQNKGSAYGRTTELQNTEKPLPPQLLAALRIAQKTVWPHATNFRRAFEMMNAADMRIVFMPPPGTNFVDEIINLPEGLFLSEQGGVVTVLAVEQERSGDAAGFQAGDQIKKIDAQVVGATLADFIQAYRAAQAAAEQTTTRQLAFTVARPDQAEPLIRKITRPPTLKGSLLDLN